MTHSIDYEAIRARMAEHRKREEAFATALRNIAKTELTRIGAVTVNAEYNGEGDSGGIEWITLSPETLPEARTIAVEVDLPDPWQHGGGSVGEITLHRGLDMLFMSLVCARHPGWENNSGGYGEIEWCLDVDVIRVDHTNIFTETEHDSFEA